MLQPVALTSGIGTCRPTPNLDQLSVFNLCMTVELTVLNQMSLNFSIICNHVVCQQATDSLINTGQVRGQNSGQLDSIWVKLKT
jgi:hypothetical protein